VKNHLRIKFEKDMEAKIFEIEQSGWSNWVNNNAIYALYVKWLEGFLVWRNVEDELPPEFVYVLVDIPNNNIYGCNNYQKNTDIGCIHFGLSQADRAKLPESDERKRTYTSGDEWSNNTRPYQWHCNMRPEFGQNVARWRYFE